MTNPESRPNWVGTSGPRFVERPAHRHWLHGEAKRLIALVQDNAFNPCRRKPASRERSGCCTTRRAPSTASPSRIFLARRAPTG